MKKDTTVNCDLFLKHYLITKDMRFMYIHVVYSQVNGIHLKNYHRCFGTFITLLSLR